MPLFSRSELVDIVLDALRFLQAHNRLTVYAYVIMENHLHLVASSLHLSDEMRKFKSYTARQIIDLLKREEADKILEDLAFFKMRFKKDRDYQVWQEGSHPQQIQNREMMRQKIEYIHYNPVRRGYVDNPTQWQYSSAGNYEGEEGLISVCIDW